MRLGLVALAVVLAAAVAVPSVLARPAEDLTASPSLAEPPSLVQQAEQQVQVAEQAVAGGTNIVERDLANQDLRAAEAQRDQAQAELAQAQPEQQVQQVQQAEQQVQQAEQQVQQAEQQVQVAEQAVAGGTNIVERDVANQDLRAAEAQRDQAQAERQAPGDQVFQTLDATKVQPGPLPRARRDSPPASPEYRSLTDSVTPTPPSGPAQTPTPPPVPTPAPDETAIDDLMAAELAAPVTDEEQRRTTIPAAQQAGAEAEQRRGEWRDAKQAYNDAWWSDFLWRWPFSWDRTIAAEQKLEEARKAAWVAEAKARWARERVHIDTARVEYFDAVKMLEGCEVAEAAGKRLSCDLEKSAVSSREVGLRQTVHLAEHERALLNRVQNGDIPNGEPRYEYDFSP